MDDAGTVTGCSAWASGGPGSSGQGQGSSPPHCSPCCGRWGPLIARCGGPGGPDDTLEHDLKDPGSCRVIGTSADMCAKRDCIQDFMDTEINPKCYRYYLFGPNSNSAVYSALLKCTGRAPFRLGIPGYQPINTNRSRRCPK